MDRRGRYSQQEKFTALTKLDRNGGNLYKTAKDTGISAQRLSDWAKARREGRLFLRTPAPALPPEAPLDDQLERIVAQMVAVMPEKVEEASLQELTRSLTTILATMHQVRAATEKSGDVLEKLASLVSRYAPNGEENRDIPPSNGEGTN